MLQFGQTRVQISLNARIRCKTEMVVKAADVWNWDSLKNCSVQLSGGADVWRGSIVLDAAL